MAKRNIARGSDQLPELKREVERLKEMGLPDLEDSRVRYLSVLKRARDKVARTENDLRLVKNELKYYNEIQEVLMEPVDNALKRSSNSTRLQVVELSRSTKSVDFRNLPEIYKTQLRNDSLEIVTYSGNNAKSLVNNAQLNRVNLGDSWKIHDDVLYHSPQGIPIKILGMDEIKKIHEISEINRIQSMGSSPNNIVLNLDFL